MYINSEYQSSEIIRKMCFAIVFCTRWWWKSVFITDLSITMLENE